MNAREQAERNVAAREGMTLAALRAAEREGTVSGRGIAALVQAEYRALLASEFGEGGRRPASERA